MPSNSHWKNTSKHWIGIQVLRLLHHVLFFSLFRKVLIVSKNARKYSFITYSLFTKYYFVYLHNRYPEHITDANPHKIIWINPSSITYALQGWTQFERREHEGRIISGKWDCDQYHFNDRPEYQSLVERYKCNKKWDETIIAKKVASGQQLWNGSQDVQKKGNQMDALYKSLSIGGYKQQKNLSIKNDLSSRIRYPDEITVCIDRDGKLLFSGYGRHRLSMAKILDLDKVPVWVHVRHSKWQEVRNDIRQATSVSDLDDTSRKYINHPDLKDIVPAHWLE